MKKSGLLPERALVSEAEKAKIIIVSVGALLQLITPREKFDSGKIHFKVGDTFDIPELCKNLTEIGYTRCETVEGKGCFSVRGGILDIFSPADDDPLRMEFFDDEIDSLRRFSLETQKSTEKIESATVIPAADTDETGSLLSYIDPRPQRRSARTWRSALRH